MEYLEALLTVDFGRPCTGGRTFCGICRHLVCQVCCPDHAVSQHGVAGDAGAARTVDVHLLEGRFPAVTAIRVRQGILGYDWTKIQRIDHDGRSYVMLGREQPNWENREKVKGRCFCGDHIKAAVRHCSPTCKVAKVQQGQGRDLIQSLVNSDFSRTHLHDRFCTSCRRPFSAAYCNDHHHHHHEGEAFRILSILRHDGWILIPEQELPAPLVSAVKRVTISEDGAAAVPVHPRKVPNSVGPRLCNRCQEAVEDDDRFCSLRCKM